MSRRWQKAPINPNGSAHHESGKALRLPAGRCSLATCRPSRKTPEEDIVSCHCGKKAVNLQEIGALAKPPRHCDGLAAT
jgi:hypothetical protein